MNNSVYILEDRALIYINGLDAKDFLQNLISNDINKVTDSSSCFASLLTPQGKFLYEFIVLKHKSGYFIDCEKSQSEKIYKQLSLYKIRSKVEILNLSNEFVVASFGYEKYLSIEGSKDILGFTFKYREDPIILDPRNKNLGARLIINLEKLYLSLKKLDLKDDKVEHYYIQSHKLGIVPKNLNQLQNKLFGIECNYEELNGIDFKKDVLKDMRELLKLSPDAVQPHIRRTINSINNNRFNDTIEESINQGGTPSDCVDLLLLISNH